MEVTFHPDPMTLYAQLPREMWLTLDPRSNLLPEGLTQWDLEVLRMMLERTLDKVNAQLLKISMIQAQNESSR